MTKKDYIIIARALKFARPVAVTTISAVAYTARAQWNSCVRSMADALQSHNLKFHRQTFYTACGELFDN